MQWWRGDRPAQGVEIEEAFKCRSCDFADDCEWRLKKVDEAKEKLRLSRKKMVAAWSVLAKLDAPPHTYTTIHICQSRPLLIHLILISSFLTAINLVDRLGPILDSRCLIFCSSACDIPSQTFRDDKSCGGRCFGGFRKLSNCILQDMYLLLIIGEHSWINIYDVLW